ncbi:hypothetical protein CMU23_06910 [Elizabethkingia anophelis]|nr:hypothetical protein [Elizabethkingia anophelis]MDV3829671.1 hypothetical protein [Elizabethkingia anophelis]
MKIKVIVFGSLFLVNCLTYTLLELGFPILKIVSNVLPLVFLIYLVFRLIKKPVKWFVMKFCNEPINDYDKYVDKPRFLVYLIFVPMLIFAVYQTGEISESEHHFVQLIKFMICNSLSFICILYLNFSWSKKFADNLRNKISNIESKNKEDEVCDFKLNYTKHELKQIYQGAIDNSIIECLVENKEMTDDDYFVCILFNGELPEKPIFKLHFDNIQTKLFFEYLSFKSDKFTLEKFMKIFINKNKKATASTVNSSASNAKSGAKDSKTIISLFEFEKKD